MKRNLVAQFLILAVIGKQKFSEAGLIGEMRGDLSTLMKGVAASAESVRDSYDDVLRESLKLLWNQRLQITLMKHQLYRIFGQTGPTPKVTEVLDSLDLILEKKANFLRDKLSVELVTGDLAEQPIEKSLFETVSKSWRQVKAILQEEQSSRFLAQVGSLLRWLDNIDLEMVMQYSTVEGLIARLKLISS